MTEDGSDLPLLGKTVPFDDFIGEMLRIDEFTPFQNLEGGNVRGASALGARALLRVEGPIAERFSLLPVYHREDFKNLWTLFETRGLGSNEEAIVVYLPAKFFLKRWFAGKLYVSVYLAGAFDLMSKAFTKNDAEAFRQLSSEIDKIEEYVPPGRDRVGLDGIQA